MIALIIELAATGGTVAALMAHVVRSDMIEARENGRNVITLRKSFRN